MVVKQDKDLPRIYVGIDISKKLFDICMMHADGKVCKTLQITPDRVGFRDLINTVPKATAAIFCMEDTGPLAGNLMHFLAGQGLQCISSNPFEVSRLREVFSKSVKNDMIDSFVLAHAARMEVLKHSAKDAEYTFFQDILERYYDLKDRKTALTNQLHANLVQSFPELAKVFHDITCRAAMAILSQYATPASLAGVDSATIKQVVNTAGGRITIKKIELLQALSKVSVAWKQTVFHEIIIQSQVRELQQVNEEIVILQHAMDDFGAASFPSEMHLLQSVPGISKITASQLLAVIGNHERFDPTHDGQGSKRVSAFAGYGVREYSSGPKKSKSGISKRGNSRLRGLLFMASFSAIKTDKSIAAIYERKKAKGNGKKAMVAISHLLLRRAYGVLKTGKLYNPTIPAVSG